MGYVARERTRVFRICVKVEYDGRIWTATGYDHATTAHV